MASESQLALYPIAKLLYLSSSATIYRKANILILGKAELQALENHMVLFTIVMRPLMVDLYLFLHEHKIF